MTRRLTKSEKLAGYSPTRDNDRYEAIERVRSMISSSDDVRASFEAWIQSIGVHSLRREGDGYYNADVNNLWLGWQAAIKAKDSP